MSSLGYENAAFLRYCVPTEQTLAHQWTSATQGSYATVRSLVTSTVQYCILQDVTQDGCCIIGSVNEGAHCVMTLCIGLGFFDNDLLLSSQSVNPQNYARVSIDPRCRTVAVVVLCSAQLLTC